MLDQSRQRILSSLSPEAVVLDIGAWASPFWRADWVMDIMPYETRGLYDEREDEGPERFGPDTWIQRDMCDREPYPFADGEIDFVICSHTLEDVRDPLWVCDEMRRVAKAGYIEVPSRLEEQTYGLRGPWTGWGHHHWLIDIEGDHIQFVFKNHSLHGRPGAWFPPEFREALTEEERVERLWWTGTFSCEERLIYSSEEYETYLTEIVEPNLRARGFSPGSRRRGPRRLLRKARAD